MSNPTQEMPDIFRFRLQKRRCGRAMPGPRASRDAKSSRGRTSCWVFGGASLGEDTERKVFHAATPSRNIGAGAEAPPPQPCGSSGVFKPGREVPSAAPALPAERGKLRENVPSALSEAGSG